jgi:hypothetical protein
MGELKKYLFTFQAFLNEFHTSPAYEGSLTISASSEENAQKQFKLYTSNGYQIKVLSCVELKPFLFK